VSTVSDSGVKALRRSRLMPYISTAFIPILYYSPIDLEVAIPSHLYFKIYLQTGNLNQ